ncbi:Ribosomal protein S13 [Elusimicrobium minutum Pei191]|uniref:Small ribosomal subunit protein uS13 n=1 Tax=Elusimicrobium minutum (strain Pei191) TaxID=445932 RepID=RS13_ELUMP|nr:30S ribosomal protein S13 [Elusimicrobium minutum]B2KEJ6.1 RecName: Full=Small ribosomal subunit protein uS13; AltName: Full=30S ribosomal protein S13 [Elusimicrobium minutum Pei191]ACC98942.1 Ribosomal protein S13 [Elusimicrobium minutum Pei191]
MARVAGIDLPKNKRIDVALEYIYGIGKRNAKDVIAKANGQIDPTTRVKDLTEAQANLLNTILQKEYKVEGELRREISGNIQRYVDTGSYRGNRHRKRLPVRGQRTKTNSRTRKGKRRTVGSKTK